MIPAPMRLIKWSIFLANFAVRAMLPLLIFAGCQQAHSLAVTTAPSRLTATQPFHDDKLVAAKDLFYDVVAGNFESLAPALQLLNDLGGGNSKNPQVVAYTGAATLLKAAHASLLEKGALANNGLALEDKAVAQAPDDLEVRFLRGVSCYKLPAFMGRAGTAKSDLAVVAQVAEQAAREGRLDRRAAAADLLYHGKELEDHYDATGAIAAWRAAVRIDSGSSAAHDALKHLAEHNVAP
jgi:hypothetical protein